MREDEIMKWIYSELEDEESKFIYLNRRRFNETNDYKYIYEIIDKYVPEFSENKWYPGKEEELVQRLIDDKKNIIIYGAGARGKAVLELFHKRGLKVDCFCDSNCKLYNTNINNEIPVLSLRMLQEQKLFYDHNIVVSPIRGYKEIVEKLNSLKCPASNIYIHAEYIGRILEEKEYLEEDILHFKNNEVFVDGGCFDLESSKNFLDKLNSLNLSYKKVYAFEPDKSNFEKCKKRIEKLDMKCAELIQAGLWSTNTYVKFVATGHMGSHIASADELDTNKVKVVALDSACAEKVTFIKMDIEGAELEALKGAKNILVRDKPKLAISIYHKKEDLWEIPYFIKKMVPEYKLYLRHYTNFDADTVLYAVC